MANVHVCAVVDISAKAIVIQCEFLVKHILQVFIYSETVSVSHVFFSIKKTVLCKNVFVVLCKKYDVSRSPISVNHTIPIHPGPFQK